MIISRMRDLVNNKINNYGRNSIISVVIINFSPYRPSAIVLKVNLSHNISGKSN